MFDVLTVTDLTILIREMQLRVDRLEARLEGLEELRFDRLEVAVTRLDDQLERAIALLNEVLHEGQKADASGRHNPAH